MGHTSHQNTAFFSFLPVSLYCVLIKDHVCRNIKLMRSINWTKLFPLTSFISCSLQPLSCQSLHAVWLVSYHMWKLDSQKFHLGQEYFPWCVILSPVLHPTTHTYQSPSKVHEDWKAVIPTNMCYLPEQTRTTSQPQTGGTMLGSSKVPLMGTKKKFIKTM